MLRVILIYLNSNKKINKYNSVFIKSDGIGILLSAKLAICNYRYMFMNSAIQSIYQIMYVHSSNRLPRFYWTYKVT